MKGFNEERGEGSRGLTALIRFRSQVSPSQEVKVRPLNAIFKYSHIITTKTSVKIVLF